MSGRVPTRRPVVAGDMSRIEERRRNDMEKRRLMGMEKRKQYENKNGKEKKEEGQKRSRSRSKTRAGAAAEQAPHLLHRRRLAAEDDGEVEYIGGVPMTYEFLSQLEDVKVGLDSELHDFLIVKPFQKCEAADEQDCPICITALEDDNAAIFLPCSHVFHSDCLQPWIADHKTCPICKQEITIDALLAQFQ
eukprot:TRINITY_DN1365_c0_g3_i2.p1 TRINITY_DN1365_c0_g3~~TRINITY_DN1365_c0_g3_i2.p1  ORF type:complete len:191 (+),score=40.34 TRINITY_DN1365_c0_g3_i2:49-621(+)